MVKAVKTEQEVVAVEVFLGVLVFTSCVEAVQCDGVKLKAMGVLGFGRDGCLVKKRQSERQAGCVSVHLSVCCCFLPSIQLSCAANKLYLEFCHQNQIFSNCWVVHFSTINKEFIYNFLILMNEHKSLNK